MSCSLVSLSLASPVIPKKEPYSLTNLDSLKPCLPLELWRVVLGYLDTRVARRAIRYLGDLSAVQEMLDTQRELVGLVADPERSAWSLTPLETKKIKEQLCSESPTPSKFGSTAGGLLTLLTCQVQDYLQIFFEEGEINPERVRWVSEQIAFYRCLKVLGFDKGFSHGRREWRHLVLSLDFVGPISRDSLFSQVALYTPGLHRVGFARGSVDGMGLSKELRDFSEAFPKIQMIEGWMNGQYTTPLKMLNSCFGVHILVIHLDLGTSKDIETELTIYGINFLRVREVRLKADAPIEEVDLNGEWQQCLKKALPQAKITLSEA